jgi:hypothetical protein
MQPGPYGPGPSPQAGASQQAIVALVLAIAGLFFCGCVTSIPAIFLARAELRAIDAGQSPVAGKSLAQIAFWIAVVDTVLVTLIGLVYAVVVVFGLAGAFAWSV